MEIYKNNLEYAKRMVSANSIFRTWSCAINVENLYVILLP